MTRLVTRHRYKVVCERSESIHVRDKPNGPSIGSRPKGRIIRTDLELDGWVRLQEDFYKVRTLRHVR